MNKPFSVSARPGLRQRMIEDMGIRGFSAKTQHDYQRIVSRFAVFLGRSPDTATAEDVRRFQVEQREAETLQVLLGHAKLDNTALYAKVATRTVRTVTSPLDRIAGLIGDTAEGGG